MELRLNRKAQASITDALFFLAIIAIISTMLFSKSMEYGQGAEERLQDVYKTKYTINALKTIMNSSATRDNLTLEESKDIDYILTLIKEQYYRSSAGNYFPEKEVIANPVVGVMEPYEASFDYLFNIYNLSTGEFMYFMLVVSEIEVSSISGQKTIVGETDIQGKGKTLYLCTPTKEGYQEFLSSLGEISQSSNIIKLSKRQADSYLDEKINSEITLATWTSVSLNEEKKQSIKCVCYKRKESEKWEDC